MYQNLWFLIRFGGQIIRTWINISTSNSELYRIISGNFINLAHLSSYRHCCGHCSGYYFWYYINN